MAEAEGAGKDPLKFLTQKVGPLPLYAWLAAAGVIWWYLERKNSSKTASATGANQQTDPAGNVGTVDPDTGYVYGSPEDSAALAAQDNTASSLGGGSAGQNATTGAQTYADNNAWGIAAVNYLVGIGINGTIASQAVQLYLNSQALTSAQQGDVNLAIQAIGAPPTLPAPATAGTVTGAATSAGAAAGVTGGSGTGAAAATGSTSTSPAGTTATPTVSNGRVLSVTTATAVIAWTGTGASSWQVTITGPGKINGQSNTVSIPQATYGGLEAGHHYEVKVQPLVGGKPAGSAGQVDIDTKGGTAATTGKAA